MLRRAAVLPLAGLFCKSRSMAFSSRAPATADLCDVHVPDAIDVTVVRDVQILEAGLFRDFGGVTKFCGPAVTIRCFENNPLVRAALEEPGQGVLVHGCIRDSAEVGTMAIGVKALGTHPLKSSKRDPGLRDVPVAFGGVVIKPGDWVYADTDGVLIAPRELTL